MSSSQDVAAHNKTQYRGAIDAVVNGRDFDAIERYYAPDVVVHHPTEKEPLRGHAAYWNLLSTAWAAFPDYKLIIESVIAEGDEVAARCVSTGTLLHPFAGFKPTGRRFTVPELMFLHFRDGKAAEIWIMPDMTRQMSQMGLMPEGPPPKPMVLMMSLMQRLSRNK